MPAQEPADRGDAHEGHRDSLPLRARLDALATWLFFAAALMVALGVIGAIAISVSDQALGAFEEAERQGRGIAAIASLGGGIATAGVLAGLGGILKALVRRDEL